MRPRQKQQPTCQSERLADIRIVLRTHVELFSTVEFEGGSLRLSESSGPGCGIGSRGEGIISAELIADKLDFTIAPTCGKCLGVIPSNLQRCVAVVTCLQNVDGFCKPFQFVRGSCSPEKRSARSSRREWRRCHCPTVREDSERQVVRGDASSLAEGNGASTHISSSRTLPGHE